MEKRVYNFSPGPAVLPLPALEEAQRDLLALPGAGISILEICHRSKQLRPRSSSRPRPTSARCWPSPITTASSSSRGGPSPVRHGPHELSARLGQVGRLHRHRHLVEKGRRRGQDPGHRPDGVGRQATNHDRTPQQGDLKLDPDAAYAYISSNETIQGVQFATRARRRRRAAGLRRSSDFLSRPVPVAKLRRPLRLCPEERRAGGGDHRDHPRRPRGPLARRPALDGELRSWPRANRC